MGREKPKKSQNGGVFWMAQGDGGGPRGWRWPKGMGWKGVEVAQGDRDGSRG